MYNFVMYLIGSNDMGFEWVCPARSADQAIGYAKKLYGFSVKIKNVREIK